MGRPSTHRSPARFVARVLPGAKPAPFPGFVEPCLATLKDKVPADARWIHEIKYDGYRAQAHLKGGKPAIYTRRGHDWTERFRPVAQALVDVPANHVILDGEIVVPDRAGVPDFAALHADLAAGRTDRLVYYAFDLLYLDGFDLRGAALVERKRVLSELLGAVKPPILYGEHIEADGVAMFERACTMQLEGIVSKRRDAPYRSGAGEAWIKVKCVKRDSFPIVAFVEKLGARPRRVASLYLGRREGDQVFYAGKARSGYTEETARQLRERLDPFIIKRSPLAKPVTKPKATWVEPVVEAEVEYSSVTADGLLREPVFKGIRDDLAPPPRAARTKPHAKGKPRLGVPQENILQWLPDAVVPAKDELARYWTKMADRALGHLGRRPLKLVRHVHGTTFYHMGRLPPVPPAVHQLTIEKREGGAGTRLWVDSLEGLLGLVAIGVVEMHPWNATVDDLERPDRLVFDLDPGEGIGWPFVLETALRLRLLLKDEGLDSWPKVTGGKGLHVMVPVDPDLDHNGARRYGRALAQRLAATDRKRYTLNAAMAERPGRLFIDYLRNGRGTTAVGAFSPRARSGFPIAAPATWKQVEGGIAPDAFTMHRPPRRRG